MVYGLEKKQSDMDFSGVDVTLWGHFSTANYDLRMPPVGWFKTSSQNGKPVA
jgi:hypothetical protein